jgi:hypothetical protein
MGEVLTEKVCAHCGGPITLPDVPGAPRKYCSITCATAANDHKLRRKCPDCGGRMACRECGWTPD